MVLVTGAVIVVVVVEVVAVESRVSVSRSSSECQ